MLTKTSETAILALIFMVRDESGAPLPPAAIAETLGASPTYLAKVCTALVKTGILRAHRGVKGGFTLAREPERITLLDIVEACQGRILGDYCQEHDRIDQVCAYHAAMYDLHRAIVTALERWTLADLAAKPGPAPQLEDMVNCRLAAVARALKEAKRTSPRRGKPK
jgi:Rrf2 family protein